ncbi:MAG: hypothetical protein ACP5G4_07040 [bacterium]
MKNIAYLRIGTVRPNVTIQRMHTIREGTYINMWVMFASLIEFVVYCFEKIMPIAISATFALWNDEAIKSVPFGQFTEGEIIGYVPNSDCIFSGGIESGSSGL